MKKVSKPTKVKFYTKSGEKIAFKPNRKVSKPLKVDFYEITSYERNLAKECNHKK